MTGYLGNFEVDINETEFKDYDKKDWALYWMSRYSQIDGSHHKTWCIDQVARILNGTKVIVVEARWEDGYKEYRVDLDVASDEYNKFIEEYENDGEYEWDEGCPP